MTGYSCEAWPTLFPGRGFLLRIVASLLAPLRELRSVTAFPRFAGVRSCGRSGQGSSGPVLCVRPIFSGPGVLLRSVAALPRSAAHSCSVVGECVAALVRYTHSLRSARSCGLPLHAASVPLRSYDPASLRLCSSVPLLVFSPVSLRLCLLGLARSPNNRERESREATSRLERGQPASPGLRPITVKG